MKNSNNSILKYLAEFLIVAFGVFLGIYVSEWRGQKKMDENVAKSMNYILTELESNKNSLQRAIEYHELIVSNMDTLIAPLTEADLLKPYYINNKFKHNKIKGWRGLGFAKFENIAYESAKLSGVFQELDMELIHSISGTYRMQERQSAFGITIVDRLTNTSSDTKTIDVIGILEMLKFDYLNSEKWILKEMEITIEQLKEKR